MFNLIGGTLSKDYYVRIVLDDLVKLIQCISKRQSLVAAISSKGGNRVARSVPTRWFSTCASINSILSLERILKSLENSEACATAKWKPIVEDDSFWKGLHECKVYFDQLSSIIGLTECEDSSLSTSFRLLLEYAKFVMIELLDTTPHIRAARYSLLKHFSRLDLELLFTAYVLNPNHRCKFMSTGIFQDLSPKFAKKPQKSPNSRSFPDGKIRTTLVWTHDHRHRHRHTRASVT